MHPLGAPREPHFVHLSWAVRRLSVTQAKYIKLFYGDAGAPGARWHHLDSAVPPAHSAAPQTVDSAPPA